MMGRVKSLVRKFIKRKQKGFTLIEVLVAMVLLAMLGVALLNALSVTSLVLMKTDSDETARDLAQAQMEYVQTQPYNAADPEGNLVFYPKIENLETNYPGYDVEIQASRIDRDTVLTNDDGIQEITVVVNHSSDTVYTLTGIKIQR